MKSGKVKRGKAMVAFNILSYGGVGLIALICLLPFIIMISGSFSTEKEVILHGYSILPRQFTLEAYATVFKLSLIHIWRQDEGQR